LRDLHNSHGKIKIALLVILIGIACSALFIWPQDSATYEMTYEIMKNPKCTYELGTDTISAVPGQELDIETCLSLGFGSAIDRAYASKLSADIIHEAELFIKTKTKHEYSVYAAREIGDFILFFVRETDVADGGFEFIYSITDKKVVGMFVAGYRG
jgi:hypothetical protein